MTPIAWAAYYGEEAMVDMLLSHNVTLESSEQNGFGPVIHAARNGRVAVLRKLVVAGADVEMKCARSARTPLSYAVEAGQLEVTRFLLGIGANVNAKDEDGHTPLRYAKVSDAAIIQILLVHGATISSTTTKAYIDPVRSTANAADEGSNSVSRMLNLLNHMDNRKKGTIQDASTLLFHGAILAGSEPLVKVALTTGVDLKWRDDEGWSALAKAKRLKHFGIVEMIVNHMQEMGLPLE